MASGSGQRPADDVHIARPYNSDEIESRVISILRSGRLVQGEFVKQFEAELGRYIGCEHVVAVNSGTAALHVAITALKLTKGNRNEVITTPLSFAATANTIFHSGCKPVFVDVDEETFNIDPSLIKEKINNNTLAVEPVDTYGLPADLDPIRNIAGSRGASVVEDAAEAIGASYQGKKIGSISTLSCFSTYATKNLHTGEGGFVTTDDEQLAEKARMIRHQGQASKYNQVSMGYNFRMLEVSAAIGLGQISHLDELNSKRRSNASYLKEKLAQFNGMGFQRVDNPEGHAWYMFAALLDEKKAGISRDNLVSRLKEKRVEADVAWPTPIHLQPYYRDTFGYKKGDFPKSERICQQVFQLPIHPFLTDVQLDRVASAVGEILGK